LFIGSISSEYDSDTTYSPYRKHVDESFSSNDSKKSPTVRFIDLHQDLNETFLCDDIQEDQPYISNNIYENQNPIKSIKVIKKKKPMIFQRLLILQRKPLYKINLLGIKKMFAFSVKNQ